MKKAKYVEYEGINNNGTKNLLLPAEVRFLRKMYRENYTDKQKGCRGKNYIIGFRTDDNSHADPYSKYASINFTKELSFMGIPI